MKFVKFFEDGIKYIGCEDGRLFQSTKGEYVELPLNIPQALFLNLCDEHKVYDFDGKLSPSNINYAMCVRNASTNIQRTNPKRTARPIRGRLRHPALATMHRH